MPVASWRPSKRPASSGGTNEVEGLHRKPLYSGQAAAAKPDSKVLKISLLGAKIALSVFLVWYAFSRIDLGSALTTLKSITIGSIAVVLVLFLIQFVLAGLRLQRLLAILGTRLSLPSSVDVVSVGAFFSQTLISFVGGDAMRVWRMVRARIPVGVAAKSVLFDRIAGFGGMFLVVLVTAPFLVPMLDSPEMTAGLLLVLGGGLASVVALLVLRRIPRSWIRHRAMRVLDDLLTSGLEIWRSREGAALVLGLSVGIQLLERVDPLRTVGWSRHRARPD